MESLGLRIAFAMIAAALLFSGCAAEKPAPLSAGADASGSFILPKSGVSYTATYVVDEGGAQMAKTVWRTEDRMRVMYGSGEQGALNLFFMDGRAYSCLGSGTIECFDITSTAHENVNAALLLPPDVSQAQPAEDVKIGSTSGKCYAVQFGPASERKFCLAERGVLAYDEYTLGNGKHVEYATSISYAVDDSVFVLPAEPKSVPEAA